MRLANEIALLFSTGKLGNSCSANLEAEDTDAPDSLTINIFVLKLLSLMICDNSFSLSLEAVPLPNAI
mgnify:CR=1 FL=1